MKTILNFIFIVLPFLVLGQSGDCTPTILIQNITANNPNPNGEVEQASDKIRVGENVGHPIFTTGPVIFDVNSEIYLQAANEITFEPGFETKQGALMVAYIAPCSDLPCPPEGEFLDGNITVNELVNTEYEYKIEITIPNKMSNVEVELMNPENNKTFFKTLTRANNDFTNNKATVKLPLYDTTSVCGNYNIEVRGQLCDGTETIEILNWNRYQLSPAYGQPSLDKIFSISLSCTIGQNCWLKIETSRVVGYEFELWTVPGANLGKVSFTQGKEEISHLYSLFNINQPVDPGRKKYILSGKLINQCKSLEPIAHEIIIDYVE